MTALFSGEDAANGSIESDFIAESLMEASDSGGAGEREAGEPGLRCGPGDPRETRLSRPVAASAAVAASVHEGG